MRKPLPARESRTSAKASAGEGRPSRLSRCARPSSAWRARMETMRRRSRRSTPPQFAALTMIRWDSWPVERRPRAPSMLTRDRRRHRRRPQARWRDDGGGRTVHGRILQLGHAKGKALLRRKRRVAALEAAAQRLVEEEERAVRRWLARGSRQGGKRGDRLRATRQTARLSAEPLRKKRPLPMLRAFLVPRPPLAALLGVRRRPMHHHAMTDAGDGAPITPTEGAASRRFRSDPGGRHPRSRSKTHWSKVDIGGAPPATDRHGQRHAARRFK